jgi:hypothetical protein
MIQHALDQELHGLLDEPTRMLLLTNTSHTPQPSMPVWDSGATDKQPSKTEWDSGATDKQPSKTEWDSGATDKQPSKTEWDSEWDSGTTDNNSQNILLQRNVKHMNSERTHGSQNDDARQRQK